MHEQGRVIVYTEPSKGFFSAAAMSREAMSPSILDSAQQQTRRGCTRQAPHTLSRSVVTDSSSGSTKLLSTDRSLSRPRRRMGPSQPSNTSKAGH